ncbi:hypothetical protein [uncultured Bacteroides sp.]|uniref:hypothetical protein n=1 Tax=uncultured Bacteroides sp. TaxID=162156 RepID=UPI0025E68145|nr:hypothetical protein [uncultured Bacteroides sp.]
MNRYIVSLYYILLLLPALSLTQFFLGIYLQNRLLWFPLGIFLVGKYRRLQSFNSPILFLVLFFTLYCYLALVNGWNIQIYLGYALTFSLLLVSNSMVFAYKDLFLSFFKAFFVLNVCYVLLQLIFLNAGLSSFAIAHTNLPAQINDGYTIPVFIQAPFFRYTGLFNESSPFAFYLCICFCFFTSLGIKYELYKKVTLVLLLFSGAKFAYLFLLLYMVIIVRSKILQILSIVILVGVIYLFISDFNYLMELTAGEMASFDGRFRELEGIDSRFSLWGNGLGKSSTGEVPLDMYSILLAGFGGCGMIVIFILIIGFYISIKSRHKKAFILPFVVGTLSCGSLLIVQYSLLSYCLIYLHKNEDY